jgi:hypothetical protein
MDKERPMDVESAHDLNPASRPDKRHPPTPEWTFPTRASLVAASD